MYTIYTKNSKSNRRRPGRVGCVRPVDDAGDSVVVEQESGVAARLGVDERQARGWQVRPARRRTDDAAQPPPDARPLRPQHGRPSQRRRPR